MKPDDIVFLQTCFDHNFTTELLYKASRDGFSYNNFVDKCCLKGATLTIIKSEYDRLFGGYISIDWEN